MNNEKQEQAKALFFQADLSKTQMAEILGIPRRTLHYWIRQNNWDRQKESASVIPVLLAENCYHVIDRFTQQLLSAETITHKDAEALHKFTITVNKLKSRATLNENMEIFGRFMDSLQQTAPAIAQAVSPFVDDYIAAQAENNMDKFKPTPNTTTSEETAAEHHLDQQDILVWAAENNPTPAYPTPPFPGPALSDSRSGEGRGEASLEHHIENLRQMYPDLPSETFEEFRQFYQENNGAKLKDFHHREKARTAA